MAPTNAVFFWSYRHIALFSGNDYKTVGRILVQSNGRFNPAPIADPTRLARANHVH